MNREKNFANDRLFKTIVLIMTKKERKSMKFFSILRNNIYIYLYIYMYVFDFNWKIFSRFIWFLIEVR